MNLHEYTVQAEATAQPAAYDRAYLIPMIVGEVGELFGQRAKAVWHGWAPERLQAELVSEYGDIAWGCAILMKLEGTNPEQVTFRDMSYRGARFTGLVDPWQQVMSKAHDVYLFSLEDATSSYVRGAAQQLWLALGTYCQDITGKSFDDVLFNNLTKLAGRVQRGTLVGSGDHR